MKPSLAEVAGLLAAEHKKDDPHLQEVWLARDPKEREVRLVEVSGSVGEIGGVLPFRYAAQEDVPYPVVLVLLSPREFERLDSELELPPSWETSRKGLTRIL